MTAEQLQEAITFLEANGWAVVPAQPTQAMLERGWYGAHDESASWTWYYMLTEAPQEAEIQGLRAEFLRAYSDPESD